MTNEENSTATSTTTELARERNRAAADRTLMAWIRTTLSMIGFGFGIGAFAEYLHATRLNERLDPTHSTRLVSGALIILGILGLLAAVIQHCQILKRIKQRDFGYIEPWPITLIMAVLLLLIGVFAFVALIV